MEQNKVIFYRKKVNPIVTWAFLLGCGLIVFVLFTVVKKTQASIDNMYPDYSVNEQPATIINQ
jgi:hypothetical protein